MNEQAQPIDKIRNIGKRPEPITPPEDKIHGLLNDSIEQIAEGWMKELNLLEANVKAMQTQVLELMAQLKDNLAQFHKLGAQVTTEAKRSQDAISKLSNGIAQIAAK